MKGFGLAINLLDFPLLKFSDNNDWPLIGFGWSITANLPSPFLLCVYIN